MPERQLVDRNTIDDIAEKIVALQREIFTIERGMHPEGSDALLNAKRGELRSLESAFNCAHG